VAIGPVILNALARAQWDDRAVCQATPRARKVGVGSPFGRPSHLHSTSRTAGFLAFGKLGDLPVEHASEFTECSLLVDCGVEWYVGVESFFEFCDDSSVLLASERDRGEFGDDFFERLGVGFWHEVPWCRDLCAIVLGTEWFFRVLTHAGNLCVKVGSGACPARNPA
jgi:hypothetical protein